MSNNKIKDKYITLKEAAELSGYAPDYIGQLIRGGKIEGKQIYSNIAWVTTEQAVRDYASQSKNGGKAVESPSSFSLSDVAQKTNLSYVYTAAMYALIVVSVLFGLFLFYLLSINIESQLNERAELKAQERAAGIPPPDNSEIRVPL